MLIVGESLQRPLEVPHLTSEDRLGTCKQRALAAVTVSMVHLRYPELLSRAGARVRQERPQVEAAP